MRPLEWDIFAIRARHVQYPARPQSDLEAALADLERGRRRSKTTPQAAVASMLTRTTDGLPGVMSGDHQRAGRRVSGVVS